MAGRAIAGGHWLTVLGGRGVPWASAPFSVALTSTLLPWTRTRKLGPSVVASSQVASIVWSVTWWFDLVASVADRSADRTRLTKDGRQSEPLARQSAETAPKAIEAVFPWSATRSAGPRSPG